MNKIRVGFWDPTGLWGARVLLALQRVPSVEISFCVFRWGQGLSRVFRWLRIMPGEAARLFPGVCYFDGTGDDMQKANAEGTPFGISFRPVSELVNVDRADIILDMSNEGDGGIKDDYQRFPGPVLWQHSVRDRGILIAPPLMLKKAGSQRYRQSTCIVSSVLPLILAFESGVTSARVQVTMQVDERSNDFMLPERVQSVRFVGSYRQRLEDEFSTLLPGISFSIPDVLQIPAMTSYVATVELEPKLVWDSRRALEVLRQVPHVASIPDEFDGTYGTNLLRSLGVTMPPIMLFENTLRVQRSSDRRITFSVGLDYHGIGVLPFIDAVLLLKRGGDPVEAMRETDRALGYRRD